MRCLHMPPVVFGHSCGGPVELSPETFLTSCAGRAAFGGSAPFGRRGHGVGVHVVCCLVVCMLVRPVHADVLNTTSASWVIGRRCWGSSGRSSPRWRPALLADIGRTVAWCGLSLGAGEGWPAAPPCRRPPLGTKCVPYDGVRACRQVRSLRRDLPCALGADVVCRHTRTGVVVYSLGEPMDSPGSTQ